MQHVGIGEHHVGPLADGFARVLRGVAIVGEGANAGAHAFKRGLQLVELVLGERLRREEVHGAGAFVAEEQIQDGQVVAEGLAAGGGGDDDHVLAGFDVVEGIGLVDVEARDAALLEGRAQAWVDGGGDVREGAGGGGLVVDGADGRIGLLMDGAEARDDDLERRLGGDFLC
ncbi:hypothetical protein SBA4_4530003 [Candidatus Sulfopaludibacter sp. SbA4]|nr:hypothetical protein SBA4_4530003 [Candidatus Sulfopaludibacter sp. SbA4]